MVEWLGLAAGFLTTASFVPQVWRTWRRKSADDLSLGMLVMFTVGVVAWLGYGWLSDQRPVIVANLVMVVLAGALMAMKLAFGRNERRPGSV
jgi:MtN3 and saliva related transmembrane protein